MTIYLRELSVTSGAIEQEARTVDGVETETISGRLDVVAAANDLFDMARDFGRTTVPAIEGEEAERFRGAGESASLEVVIGRDDELLADYAPTSISPQPLPIAWGRRSRSCWESDSSCFWPSRIRTGRCGPQESLPAQ